MLVEAYLSIPATERQGSSHRGIDRAEHWIRFVRALRRYLMTTVYSRINCEHVLFTDALEKLTDRVLRILELIDEHRAALIS